VKEDRGRRRRGSWSGTLFLFLRGTSTHLPTIPLIPPRALLVSPVPLNKLVRFNDSYFFLVTRLPSFAPTRRLRKVAVNLVPSVRLFPLTLHFGREGSPGFGVNDSSLVPVCIVFPTMQSRRRPRYQRMQSSPIQ